MDISSISESKTCNFVSECLSIRSQRALNCTIVCRNCIADVPARCCAKERGRHAKDGHAGYSSCIVIIKQSNKPWNKPE